MSYEATVSAEQWYREASVHGIDGEAWAAAEYWLTTEADQDDGYLL